MRRPRVEPRTSSYCATSGEKSVEAGCPVGEEEEPAARTEAVGYRWGSTRRPPPRPAAPAAEAKPRTHAIRPEQLLVRRRGAPAASCKPRQHRPRLALPGNARPPLPAGTSPFRHTREQQLHQHPRRQDQPFRAPAKRTGVISTTALFVSPWNTVPARRATSAARSPGRGTAPAPPAAPPAPSRPARPPSPPGPPPRAEAPEGRGRTPPPRRGEPACRPPRPPEHDERAAPGPSGPREVEAGNEDTHLAPHLARGDLEDPEATRPQLDRGGRGAAGEDLKRDRVGIAVPRAGGDTASGAAARTHEDTAVRRPHHPFRVVSASAAFTAFTGRRRRGGWHGRDGPVERRLDAVSTSSSR